MPAELTESLLSKAAGWEAMKRARAYIAQDQVLSSYWAPPLLRGVVQINGMSFRASMVIQNEIDIENLCTCREARESGIICAHSVAVGLHWIAAQNSSQPAAASKAANTAASAPKPAPAAPAQKPGIRFDPDGAPAELRIILPPSLDRAIEAGRFMLVLEARLASSSRPLNMLSREGIFSFSDQDRNLIEHFRSMAGGEVPAMLQLSREQFTQLLPLLAGHPGLTLGKSTEVRVASEPIPVSLRAELEPNGEIVLSTKSGGPPRVLLGSWLFSNNTFAPLALPGSVAGVLEGPVRLSRAQIPAFLGRHWPALQEHAEANFKLSDFVLEPQAPKFLLELTGGLARLTALLQCAYGARIMTPGVTAANEDVWLPDPASPTRYSTRDTPAERAALARLLSAGFIGPDTQGRLLLSSQAAVLNFFAREYPRLQKEWSVTMEERLTNSTRQNIERIEPRLQITPSGVQWFDLGVVFASTSGQTFSQADVQRLLLSGQGHTRLPNGKFAVVDTESLDEFQEALRDCAPQQHSQGYRINNAQAAFLQSTFQEHPEWKVQAPQSWRSIFEKQTGRVAAECPDLGTLEAVVRPYQKAGIAWLGFLRANNFGGILADEMGLGKTLQALAFIRHLRKSTPGLPPVLVVCPTSLVYNWVAEAQKFTPELKVLALHGPDRHRSFPNIPGQDIVVTSYALIRRDWENYREHQFDTVVLDEAQHIKNRQTQNAQAVKRIRARQRLVLTGTPLENSVLDLWSIFDFLMPGYLGTAQDFKERYEIPITRDKDPRTQSRLARRLRPFLLRRRKAEVATELPEKIQQVAYCEMTADQKALYQQVLEATRKEVLDAVGQQGLAKSRMVVLSALLRLRQICCDLRLLKLEGTRPEGTSGKVDLFSELLEEIIDGGHRVLVFSQFTTMLGLLKEHLEAEQIDYTYLDGSTKDRAAVVQRFQQSPAIPVFLISLKAGGVGLNLTAADTVIHFDPWWNPAVEDQATDRAHRIGQKNIVTSYKLITRDSVEEKILALQSRKREIIKATISGEEEFTSALSWEDIQEVLGIG